MTAVALPRAATTLRPVLLAGVMLVVFGSLLVGQGLYIRAKAMLAQVLLERAWSETLATGRPVKAWSWADTHPVAKISFPRLGESEIVLEDGGGEALAFGPAHVAGSPLPGARGTSVIGGHRDTHFVFLKDVRQGDEIVVATANGYAVRYHVTGTAIVHPQSSGIATGGSVRRLALVTCYPFDAIGHSPLRYVVFAEAH
jgi:sortase A